MAEFDVPPVPQPSPPPLPRDAGEGSVPAAPGIAALLACAVVTSCGGGTGVQSAITLSSTSISQTSSMLDAAPTVTIRVDVANPPADGVTFSYAATGNAISYVSWRNGSGTAEAIIVLKSPALLGSGTFMDTVRLSVCYDPQCTAQLGNSPQDVAVQYTVTTAAAQGT